MDGGAVMGIRRVVDVLLYAPKDLTAAERMVLVAIGENVRDSDPKRETWPDFNVEVLAERTGLTGKGSLKSALQRLAKRGIEVRIPITHGVDGRAVYALPGKQCRYRFPVLEGEDTASPSGEGEEKGEALSSPGEATTSPMGRTQPRQGRTQPPPTPPPHTPPPSSEETPLEPTPLADRQQRQEGRLGEAASFLEELPAPWAVGPVTAKAMAADLWNMTQRQGWDLDGDLAAKLTENASGPIRNHSAILRIRIGDLPRRGPKPKARNNGSLPDWCGECADGNKAAALEGHLRQIYDDRGNARPCPKCHPSQASQAA